MVDFRKYDDFVQELDLRNKSRAEIRKFLVSIFLSEKGGYWKDGVKHVTRYKYNVERLADGRRIFLQRPAHLNKGMDFQVFVERFIDEKDKKPSHKQIISDLAEKKLKHPKLFPKLLEAINRVWACEEPDEVLADCSELTFSSGFPVELLLKTLKWLFIEQDITYWNYDGREMLKRSIDAV